MSTGDTPDAIVDAELVAEPPPPVAPPPPPLAPPVFYRINSSRVSLREYWWGSKNPVSLVVATILKTFRVPIPSATDDPNVESLHPFETTIDALPPAVRVRFEAFIAELEELGFRSPAVFHAIDDTLHNCKQYLATLYHESGSATARLHNRIWAVRHPPKDTFFTEYLTELADGRFLWSLSSKPDLLAPRGWPTVRRRSAVPAALWALHQRELGKLAADGTMITPVRSRDEMLAALERHQAGVRDYHLARGVFAPLSPADQEQAAALAARRSAGVEHADILAEMDKLQRRQTNWTTAIALLLLSLVLFIAAFSVGGTGGGAGSAPKVPWRFVWLIIPILFFHELGHYVAMRVFRYRNVRMFFVPFLGAAVIGQNFTAPGWKKVIVALMGPIPGILVGGVLGIVGLSLHKPLWVEVGLFAVILNGLQLIPVMPLDGGRVVHTLFFSRHWVLDVGFRAAAGVLLLVAWFFTRDTVLAILGGFMLIGIPPIYRLARISSDLRRAGIAREAVADQFVPTEIAQTIIGRIKSSFGPRGLSNKIIAQHVLTVYETIATRPPGAFATVGFAVAHAGSLILAVVLAAGLFYEQRGAIGFGRHHQLADYLQPKHPLEVGEIASRQDPQVRAMPDRVAAVTVIATFGSATATDRAFDAVSADLPPLAAVVRFGRSLLITSYDRNVDRAWLARMKKLSPDTAVDDAKHYVPLAIACTAPDEARAAAIQQELEEYLRPPAQAFLIPPWQPNDPRPPAQREQDALARRTFIKIEDAQVQSAEDPAVLALGKRVSEAYRRGDANEANRLLAEQESARAARERAILLALKQDGGVNAAMVDDVLAHPLAEGDADNYEAYYRALGRRMGQLALDGDHPPPGGDRYAHVGGGGVDRDGKKIRVTGLTFANVTEAAPALVAWLDQQGCTTFRYQFFKLGGEYEDNAAPTTAPGPEQ